MEALLHARFETFEGHPAPACVLRGAGDAAPLRGILIGLALSAVLWVPIAAVGVLLG